MPFLRTLLSVAILVSTFQQAPPAEPAVPDSQAFLEAHLTAPPADRSVLAEQVEELIARMTLREKAGQMTQLTLEAVVDGQDDELTLNPDKLRSALVDHGVGSIINVHSQAMPVERWHRILGAIQSTAAESRLGIPVLYGLDSIHGANYISGSTLFPQPLAMAATWNPQLQLEVSRATAAATRAAGVPWNFAPILDVGRQPLWPRLWETFGEDVHLAAVMGVATVQGLEGEDLSNPRRVASSIKHYVGYSVPDTGHDRTPALIPEITLREYLLPPFTAAVRAGARTLMVNSGEVNGIPGHVNRWLLTDVLRGELGFEGVVVTDWEDIKKLVTIHRVAETEKEATRMSVLAGIDMSMVPLDTSFAELLVELVEEGAVPMSRIDESVRRILMLKAELGLFDDPLLGIGSGVEIGAEATDRLARVAAREAITLLRNQQSTLPLSDDIDTVLVTGPTADSMVALNNGWSRTWQGDRPELLETDRPTVLGAIRERLGADRVVYAPGVGLDEEIDIAAAVEAARDADVAVICLGEMAYAETPGNIDDLYLPAAQLRLAEAVQATGTPSVLVLLQGRPRIIREVVPESEAVLMAYNPGTEGGLAVAEVLFGDVNPSGRLPITYPRFPNALRTYDHKAFEALDTEFGFSAFRPQWQFGAGLSYTRFEYSDLELTERAGDSGDELEVAVTLRNAGPRAGAEVVQLYVGDLVASVTPPVKRLRRFVKLELEPGEQRRLTFTLSRDDLSFVGREHRWTFEPGAFSVMVGDLEREIRLE